MQIIKAFSEHSGLFSRETSNELPKTRVFFSRGQLEIVLQPRSLYNASMSDDRRTSKSCKVAFTISFVFLGRIHLSPPSFLVRA